MIAQDNRVSMFLLALLFVFISRISSTTTDGKRFHRLKFPIIQN